MGVQLVPDTNLFVFLIPALLGLIIQIIALISVIKSRFANENEKIIWLLVVVFMGCFGAILYFSAGLNRRINV